MKQKQMYEAPATEVLELRMEGVIATSLTGSPDADIIGPGAEEDF